MTAARLDSEPVRLVHTERLSPVVELGDVKRVFVHGCSSAPGVGAFVRVPERCASELVLEANSFGAIKKPVERVAAER